jgi:hypothetical protein
MKLDKKRVLGLSAAVLALVATPVVWAQIGSVEVIADGLNNPRGLNFGPAGVLYVAEAGSGGDGACQDGPEGERCYGATGSVARINLKKGDVDRLATGLPSLASPDGSFATGPHDIFLQGLGNVSVTIGYGGDPRAKVASLGPVGAYFARLARVQANGKWSLQEDLGAYEAATNPTGDEVDSNPYSILSINGNKRVYTDAGGNTLNEISANGKIKTLATFPNRLVTAPPLNFPFSMDQVPTTVTVGPDGAYYVGQLTGFPFPVDGANVYRVPAEGGTPTVYASGFTAIIDIAFGADGSLYVLEIAKNGLLAGFGGDWTGALIKVSPDGTRTELVPGQLTAPGGIAIGADGYLYVTNNSIFSGIGQVLKIAP